MKIIELVRSVLSRSPGRRVSAASLVGTGGVALVVAMFYAGAPVSAAQPGGGEAAPAEVVAVPPETEVPVLSAVLTPHHFHEHAVHADFFRAHMVTKKLRNVVKPSDTRGLRAAARLVSEAAKIATLGGHK